MLHLQFLSQWRVPSTTLQNKPENGRFYWDSYNWLTNPIWALSKSYWWYLLISKAVVLKIYCASNHWEGLLNTNCWASISQFLIHIWGWDQELCCSSGDHTFRATNPSPLHQSHFNCLGPTHQLSFLADTVTLSLWIYLTFLNHSPIYNWNMLL